MNSKTFIFIGGLHRSGTSLLFRILRDHPSISGFRDTGVPEDEGQLLQSVYPPARAFGGPGRFGLNAESFLDETSALVSAAAAGKLYQEWGRHWDLDKPCLLEKSPPNLVRTRFLQALFPNSRFIMLLRHPVAVAFATRKWSRTPIDSLIEHWVRCHERFDADRKHLAHVFALRYEDFVAAPQDWIDRICAFLGLDRVPVQEPVQRDVNERYFERWQAAEQKRPGDARRIVDDYEARVRRYGYSLRDLRQLEPYPEAGARAA